MMTANTYTCPRCDETRDHDEYDEAACPSCGVCSVCIPTYGCSGMCARCAAPGVIQDHYTDEEHPVYQIAVRASLGNAHHAEEEALGELALCLERETDRNGELRNGETSYKRIEDAEQAVIEAAS